MSELDYNFEYVTSPRGEKYLKFELITQWVNDEGVYVIDSNSYEFSKKKVVGDTLYLYFDATKYKNFHHINPNPQFEIPLNDDKTYDKVKVYYRISKIDSEEIRCNQTKSEQTTYEDISDDKPIIYIYPLKEMDLTIKLGNENMLTHTYPKYSDSWNVHVDTNGNIYDYKTNKNYYALYWESIDDTSSNMSEGFVIEGKNTISFLEEKLEYLGLNEREINEFIIYWIDELENNKYNYIRFRTLDEINKHMPLEFSENPDTLIRIIMDFKPLDKKIDVKEQKLTKVTRSGFTIVEWGGRKLN